jgi:hypothetical protein
MSNNVFARGASRRYGRLALLIGVLLVGVLCTPTKPGPNRCPHYPPPPPLDASDPVFQIISPNGGEVFHVGDQCTVKVRSRLPCPSALIFVDIGGKSLWPPSFSVMTASLPGDSAAGSAGDSTINAVIFTVPDSLTQLGGGMVYSVSDSCLITITDYKTETYSDFSDCYFSIKK